ncbi:MAG TPA: methylenetetrahydrofolate--tRNA-(uracil(54)-C(5))-methyltransferase (FADH(2)-oxidizing) TrmFO, partial [Nitrospiraceae bacterium]|nr:methylenetetrahydrofolate--tRNA-(uracil(54)-C(5))-methyltransferase (FADH(2)-oxidizing) TrmFO [Nitrospiraceae bacterium]
MKPVGLKDLRTGEQPYAVIQLRQEDKYGQAYNMVGFQTRLKWPDQRKVFRMIPGLEQAEFLRYGSLHRNTFINSPLILDSSLRLKKVDNIYMAGQITGVEGYTESVSSGLLAGLSAAHYLKGNEFPPPPETTCMGALLNYVTSGNAQKFQPMNINWGLIAPLSVKIKNKDMQRKILAERAIEDIVRWKEQLKVL